MTKPGYPSAASLATFPLSRQGPPPPPKSLSGPGRAVWHQITVRFRSDWFAGGGESLLESYCEMVVAARQLAAELTRCDVTSENYREFLKLYLSVVGTLCSVGTKLRITNQSSRDSRITKLTEPGPYPWEPRDSDEAESAAVQSRTTPCDGERDFSSLLRQQRARRAVRATIACTEAADV